MSAPSLSPLLRRRAALAAGQDAVLELICASFAATPSPSAVEPDDLSGAVAGAAAVGATRQARSGAAVAAAVATSFTELEELVEQLVSLVRSTAEEGDAALAAKQEQLERAQRETSQLLEAAGRLELQAQTAGAAHAASCRAAAITEQQLRTQLQERDIQQQTIQQHARADLYANAIDSAALTPTTTLTPSPSASLRASCPTGLHASLALPRNNDCRGPRAQPVLSGGCEGTRRSLYAAERQLSLKQLREMIEELYSSKAKHDVRCEEGGMPRETMEQHLYTYLNTRYGLKGLILEYSSACYDGVERFSATDNDVAVFGCILRNELDEEFRLVQKQLKTTASDLLRVHLKGKHRYKRDAEINAMLNARTAGAIHKEEWIDIVQYMYAPPDASVLTGQIKAAAAAASSAAHKGQQPPATAVGRGRGSKSAAAAAHASTLSLPFQDFVQVLLDYQLSGHRQFLRPFVSLFRTCDSQGKGIVDERGFRQLVALVCPHLEEAEVGRLLELIDPCGHRRMTFSDCVATLSKELVAMLSAEA